MFFSNEGPTLETLDFACYIGSFINSVLYFAHALRFIFRTYITFMTGMIWFIFKPCSLLLTSQSDMKGSFGQKSGIYKDVIINK